jgi:hypothetical protein
MPFRKGDIVPILPRDLPLGYKSACTHLLLHDISSYSQCLEYLNRKEKEKKKANKGKQRQNSFPGILSILQ